MRSPFELNHPFFPRSAVAETGGTQPAPIFDPEAGLTQTASFAPLDVIPNLTSVASQSVVMAADFTGLDGVASAGFIAEMGGGGMGALAGFYADGRFVARCGSGAAEWNDTATAYNIVPAGLIHGDGTLVVEFNKSTGAVTIWWNGVEVGYPAGHFPGNWTGSDTGLFLGGKQNASASSPLPDQAPDYTTASNLRTYSNQVVAR